MVCSGGLMAKTTDEVKKRCQQMNPFRRDGEEGAMVAGYHNHNGEFDGSWSRPQYDLWLEHLDSALVQDAVPGLPDHLGLQGRTISASSPVVSSRRTFKTTTRTTIEGSGLGNRHRGLEDFLPPRRCGLPVHLREMESTPPSWRVAQKYVKRPVIGTSQKHD